MFQETNEFSQNNVQTGRQGWVRGEGEEDEEGKYFFQALGSWSLVNTLSPLVFGFIWNILEKMICLYVNSPSCACA